MRSGQVRWLHEHYEFSLAELCELSGLTEVELRGLVDCGAIAPVDPLAREWIFSADRLVVARSAQRLRKDFDLDQEGLALALALLGRVHDLEEQLRGLRARLPGEFPPGRALSPRASPRARASRAARTAPPKRAIRRA